MPNGRSGGFLIGKTDLEGLLRAQRKGSPIGRLVSAPRATPDASISGSVTAAAAIRMVQQFKPANVWVEEQDLQYYIVHLDLDVQEGGEPDAEKWVVVGSDSPLFLSLRQQQHR